MTRFQYGLLVALAAVTVAARPTGAQRGTHEQHVFVGVSTRNNTPATGLTAQDFTVREDSIVREVLRAGPAGPPSHLALLVDDSQATAQLISDLRNGLGSYVKAMAGLPTPSAISVMTFGERPNRQVDFTTSVPVLERAALGIVPRTGAGAYLLDAIVEACKDLKAKEAPQPAILMFVVEEGPEFSNRTNKNVVEALKDAHASLWAVVLQSNAPLDSDPARERAQVINDATTQSGGMAKTVLSKEGIADGFKAVQAAMTSRYDVVYGRPEAMIPPSRLEVQVRDRSLKVIAPRWTGQ